MVRIVNFYFDLYRLSVAECIDDLDSENVLLIVFELCNMVFQLWVSAEQKSFRDRGTEDRSIGPVVRNALVMIYM